MLTVKSLIFSILTLSILTNYAVKAFDRMEERQNLSLEGKITILICYIIIVLVCWTIPWVKFYFRHFGLQYFFLCMVLYRAHCCFSLGSCTWLKVAFNLNKRLYWIVTMKDRFKAFKGKWKVRWKTDLIIFDCLFVCFLFLLYWQILTWEK